MAAREQLPEGSFRSVYLPGIPYELRAAPRWGVWRLEPRGTPREPTKVPYSAVTGRRASATNLAEWTRFDLAASHLLRLRRHDGIGFLLGDGWSGIDLDRCLNPQSGELVAWAARIVENFDSYTEVSPSGTGLKVFMRGARCPRA
jgi:putative DNA primase/helicase